MQQRFNWGHININVSDLDAAIAFYRKLGFTPFMPGIPYLNLGDSERTTVPGDAGDALGLPPDTRGRACIMQLGDGFPKLDLTEFTDLEQRAPLRNTDRGLVRLCLVSQDLERDVEELRAAGVDFISPPRVCHARLADVAVCTDPDGTLIELLQVHLDRWAPLLAGQQ